MVVPFFLFSPSSLPFHNTSFLFLINSSFTSRYLSLTCWVETVFFSCLRHLPHIILFGNILSLQKTPSTLYIYTPFYKNNIYIYLKFFQNSFFFPTRILKTIPKKIKSWVRLYISASSSEILQELYVTSKEIFP